MIKSSRYLNRSITPAQTLIERNLYQGCKWSSPADTSTGLSHLLIPFLKEISIRGANDQVQPIPQPVYHTCPNPYWKESLSGVQMIKSSRYLNRSITPAHPFLKRNLYQGCKWSSPADTSTGLSHLPKPLLKGISIRGANDQVQLIPQPVYHTCPSLS